MNHNSFTLLIFLSHPYCLISLFVLNKQHDVISVLGSYNNTETFTLNKSIEYVISYSTKASIYPTKLTSVIRGTLITFPLMVVVRQEKSVTSWKLPLEVNSREGNIPFYTTSRVLCHNKMKDIVKLNRTLLDWFSQPENSHAPNMYQEFSTSLSTSSNNNLAVKILTEEVTNFFVIENENYEFVISPSEPYYFYYKFFDKGSDNFSDTVVLEVHSGDDTCFYVSIQNPNCPVLDLENDIDNSRLYQTVKTKGGLTIGNFEFPNGFFIVFVAKADNYDCSIENSFIGNSEIVTTYNQSSRVNFKIRPSISVEDYIKAAITLLGFILVFYVLFICVLYIFYAINKRSRKNSENLDVMDSYILNIQSPVMMTILDDVMSTDDIDSKLNRSAIYLSDLARKSPELYYKKSLNYFWQVLIIAIFYGIPVVQLVITYQRILYASGNQDFCYYNFLCANPLFGMSDFNHIFSNIPYVFVGIFFLLIVFLKDKWEIDNPSYGIPKHYGLYYAMGMALIIEGILSACYHICPNQANFQFDTSFMYVLAVLSVIKLYQKRHPDINAVAYATFLVLGIAIFMATIGIVNGSLAIWILFMVLYIIFCLYLSINAYFMSYVKYGLKSAFENCIKSGSSSLIEVFKPRRTAHFLICFIGNILNTTMALMGIYCYLNGTDFGTYLLYILLGNAALYCIAYTCLKLSNGEKICWQAIFFGVLSLLTWGASGYFFINQSTLWYISPAESRQKNTNCKFLNFYDYHDIWHFLSAPALLFTFIYIMVLDDDIKNKPHHQISVF